MGGASFGVLLGLSLPSAGGLLWGCSRCRQLRDPSSSVPIGSCGAALGTTLGYVGGALLLGAGLERHQLRDRSGQSLRGLAGLGQGPWLPLAGALLSAAGTGLEALLGGSLLLRGLCRARALPLPPALGRGRLLPLAATGLVAALGVLIGSFDLVAPVVSEFWLTSYLGLNLACGLQGLLPPPGWAPQCRCYHWAVSLAGAGLCLALMLVTCWYGALLAMAIGATAHQYVQYRRARSAWGEGLRGLSLGAAQVALLRLEDEQPPAASWRPQLLVLVELEEEQQKVAQPQLLALASHLGVGQGLTVVASLVPGELPQDQPRADQARQTLRSALAACRCRGFAQVLVWPGPLWAGLAAMAQGCGLGALRPNAVLLGWPRGWAAHPDPSATARGFVELLRVAGSGGRSLLVAKGTPGDPLPGLPPFGDPSLGDPPPGAAPGSGAGAEPSLDVWWVVGDGRLLTLLPRLLRRHPAWRGCPLRLFTVALLEDNSERMRRMLAAVARRRGLGEAQTQVVELHDGAVSAYTAERTLMVEQRAAMAQALRQGGLRPSEAEEALGAWTQRGPDPGNVRRMHAAERLNEVIGRCSGGARLVLLDLPPPPPPRPDRPVDTYLEFLEVLTEGLGPVLLVRDGS
ncbi:solute carrier family 12 member 4-like [Melanerpes formicivorus]|uniref:solute carrier family 12 member 4-like n=1 Tax=Melanerpes formicivorus TaxID=211600 RepID=UPI00358E2521